MRPLLALNPNSYIAGKLYSTLPEDGTGDFTVSRNGGGTRVNKNGLIESVPAHVPRFNYDPLSGEFLGVLVGNAATNLLLHSEDFTNSFWNQLGGRTSTTLIQGLAPDGTNNLNKITCTQSSTSGFGILRTPLIYLATNYFSIFTKKGNLNGFKILFTDGGTNSIRFQFNLQTKTYSSSFLSGTGFSFLSAKIIELKNNLFRLEVNFNTTHPSGLNVIYPSSPTVVSSFANTIGDFGFIWGAQLGDFPTSYIPTTTASLPRPADIITVTIPAGATEVIYVNNGVQTTLPVTAGSTFQLPVGLISKLWMN